MSDWIGVILLSMVIGVAVVEWKSPAPGMPKSFRELIARVDGNFGQRAAEREAKLKILQPL